MKEDEISRICSTHGGDVVAHRILVGKPEERDQ
jgi:hypothetical protein